MRHALPDSIESLSFLLRGRSTKIAHTLLESHSAVFPDVRLKLHGHVHLASISRGLDRPAKRSTSLYWHRWECPRVSSVGSSLGRNRTYLPNVAAPISARDWCAWPCQMSLTCAKCVPSTTVIERCASGQIRMSSDCFWAHATNSLYAYDEQQLYIQ